MVKEKKKLIFLIPTMSGGGVEHVLLRLLESLDYNLFEVTLSPITDEGELRTKIPKEIIYKPVAKRYTKRGLRIPGISIFISVITKILPSKLLYYMLVKEQYDLCIVYHGLVPLKIISCANKKIAWIHSDVSTNKLNEKYPPFKNEKELVECYLKYDKLLFVSEDSKNSFTKQYNISNSYEEKLVIQYSIVKSDEIKEKSNEPINIKKNSFTICAIGRLVEGKGFIDLIEAIQVINNQYSNDKITLWILGEGLQRLEIEKLIQLNGLQNEILLLGYQDNPFPYIKAADLFVCASKTEAMPTVIIEALILKKAIVTTPVNGVNEILGHSEYGLIAKGYTSEDLIAEILKIYTDKNLREYYENKSVVRSNLFNADIQRKKTQDIFLKVIEGSR